MAPTAADLKKQQQQQRMADVPDLIVDRDRDVRYVKGKFLGKGGFAHCYELRNMATAELVAGKIVSKTLLTKQYQRDKMAQEVSIHRNLRHENVVRLFSFFEDHKNVYITLELCARRSLMELHKRRKAVTDPEARYFTVQVCRAVEYLHEKRIIHRDLKLGNLFLNDEMMVKIGDFGLATTVDEGERKRTLCGTPNYIAPEVLEKRGHSFEVDIWAIGCILYTLLFGKPPFETESLKTLEHSYFQGFTPRRLPVSCLSMPPKFNLDTSIMPPPVPPVSAKSTAESSLSAPSAQPQRSTTWAVPAPIHNQRSTMQTIPEHNVPGAQGNALPSCSSISASLPRQSSTSQFQPQSAPVTGDVVPGRQAPSVIDFHLTEMHQQVLSLISSQFPERSEQEMMLEDEQSPEAVPVFWIAKWVDYSDKYGIGYTLCDNSVGVLFNDNTKMILDEMGTQLTYIEKGGNELYYNMHEPPQELNKKVTLLNYFRNYMNEHLVKAGQLMQRRDGDEMARLPVLQFWFRTKSAMVLHLTNGTLQINFFHDHIKMVICPLMQAVTFIDQDGAVRTYKLIDLQRNGCSKSQVARLRYASTMIERLLKQCNAGQTGRLYSSQNLNPAQSSVNQASSSLLPNTPIHPNFSAR
ncbi:hypothetical protein WR25_15861 [Diploscapter pachys]|uniref:Serine/threonine-protein kinase PLK n=1 Tax=Diploscapter pachys TaxID=2018661 RepID=A0A2A2LM98_9BILA|nr:hypothetical protein WR25_15861 [Diploscapter pachys]